MGYRGKLLCLHFFFVSFWQWYAKWSYIMTINISFQKQPTYLFYQKTLKYKNCLINIQYLRFYKSGKRSYFAKFEAGLYTHCLLRRLIENIPKLSKFIQQSICPEGKNCQIKQLPILITLQCVPKCVANFRLNTAFWQKA